MKPHRRRQPPTPTGEPTVWRSHVSRRHFAPEHCQLPTLPRLKRYRRAYDGAGPGPHDGALPERRRRRRSVMEGIRRTPLRDGLVGLAMVGAATPLAMTRLSTLRTDPAHEETVPMVNAFRPVSDQSISDTWRAEEGRIQDERTTVRDTMIEEKVQRYGDMGLDRELAESIYDLALEAEIDPDVAFGLVRTESEFKPTAKSHVGALGLTQLMPATARWLRPGTTSADLRQPEINMRIGFKYLRQLIDKYDGNQELALLAYNRGPGTVDRVLARGGDPNNGYVEAVLTGKGVH